jgi:teichuronic acid exporter
MFKNILWDLAGKFGGQIVYFGVSILLARLLSPQEYGIMGMAMAVITFAHVFLDFGFNSAIVQGKEVTQRQLSSIFYLNAVIALALTLLCFFAAAPLAAFYKQPLIKPVFRVLSVSFLLNGLSLVPSSLLYRRMNFKINSIISFIATVVSGIIGAVMAYKRYGVWSLVAQSLVSTFLSLILMVVYLKWLPLLYFSLRSIAPFWKYSSKLFLSGVLNNLYTRMDTFIIGKVFSAATLGFYTRAQSMENMVRQFSVNSIMGTLFPHIARHQDDRPYLAEFFLKYLNIILFVSVGLSGLLFLIAKPLFILLFKAKWIYSAELFQLMTLIGFAWPVSSLMCNLIIGVGNSAGFLKLEVYKRLIILPAYIFGFLIGLKAFIIFMCIVSLVCLALNAIYVSREVEVSLQKQMLLIINYCVVGLAASIITYGAWVMAEINNNIFSVVFITLIYAISYLAISFLRKLEGTNVINLTFQKLKFSFQ